MTGSLAIKNGKYYAVLNVYEMGVRKKKWICSNLPEKGNKRKKMLKPKTENSLARNTRTIHMCLNGLTVILTPPTTSAEHLEYY